jgi:hypothetical protein
LFVDVTGTLHLGNWNLSLKERLQNTFRSGSYNRYQNPVDVVTLKSRLTVKYKGFRVAAPYAYFELRTCLNAPVVKAAYDGSDYYTLDGELSGEPGWFLKGFKGCYNNRYRGAVGSEFRVARQHVIDACFMGDYFTEKKLDANSRGTELKSYNRQFGFLGTFALSYTFSF